MFKNKTVKIASVVFGCILLIIGIALGTSVVLQNITSLKTPNESIQSPKENADATYNKAEDAQGAGKPLEAISLYKSAQTQYESLNDIDGTENSKLKISIVQDQTTTDAALKAQDATRPKESLDP